MTPQAQESARWNPVLTDYYGSRPQSNNDGSTVFLPFYGNDYGGAEGAEQNAIKMYNDRLAAEANARNYAAKINNDNAHNLRSDDLASRNFDYQSDLADRKQQDFIDNEKRKLEGRENVAGINSDGRLSQEQLRQSGQNQRAASKYDDGSGDQEIADSFSQQLQALKARKEQLQASLDDHAALVHSIHAKADSNGAVKWDDKTNSLDGYVPIKDKLALEGSPADTANRENALAARRYNDDIYATTHKSNQLSRQLQAAIDEEADMVKSFGKSGFHHGPDGSIYKYGRRFGVSNTGSQDSGVPIQSILAQERAANRNVAPNGAGPRPPSFDGYLNWSEKNN